MSSKETGTTGRLRRCSSNIILGIGIFLILYVLCTAFTLTPAQAAVNRTAARHAPSLTWSGWKELPGGGRTLSAPAMVPYKGKDYVFVRGTNNRIWLNTFNGSSWSRWSQVPGGGATLASPGATSYAGSLYVFVRGTNNGIWLNTFNGSSWSRWSQVPGGGVTLDSPGANPFGRALYVFVRGTNNGIWLNILS